MADQGEEQENDVNCQTEGTGEGSPGINYDGPGNRPAVWVLKSEIWPYNRPHDEQGNRVKCFSNVTISI